MRPAPRVATASAGSAPEAGAYPLTSRTGTPGRTPEGTPSGGRCWLLLGSLVVTSAATIAFGIVPSPLIDFSLHAGRGIASMVGLG
jgi:hypothetical protein